MEAVGFGVVGTSADKAPGRRLGGAADQGVSMVAQLVASTTLYHRWVVATDYEFDSASKHVHAFCLRPFHCLPHYVAEGQHDHGSFCLDSVGGNLPEWGEAEGGLLEYQVLVGLPKEVMLVPEVAV